METLKIILDIDNYKEICTRLKSNKKIDEVIYRDTKEKERKIPIFKKWNECNNINIVSKNLELDFEENEEYIKLKPLSNEKKIGGSPQVIKNNNEDTKDIQYYVYIGGVCKDNGKIEAIAGIGIYFGEKDKRNISKKISGKNTNNIAELMAFIETYKIIKDDFDKDIKIGIVSDSEYAIKCITSFGEKCEIELWKKNIPNKNLVRHAYELYKGKKNIKILQIKAHTNNNDIHSFGNKQADILANNAIGLKIK